MATKRAKKNKEMPEIEAKVEKIKEAAKKAYGYSVVSDEEIRKELEKSEKKEEI